MYFTILGSISLSEDEGETDDNEVVEQDRPQNPMPGNRSRGDKLHAMVAPNEERGNNKPKSHSMEQVIDDMFQQTQYNIDTIYRHGLESMDIETYRSDTITPDTCMKRLEEELMRPSAGTDSQTKHKDVQKNAKNKKTNKEANTNGKTGKEANMNNEEMDNLLNEVSIWAVDRQKWLLEDSKITPEPNTRESTTASPNFDGKAIAEVSRSNSGTKERCSNWVTDQDQRRPSEGSDALKINGLLTGPKLFRSTSKTPLGFRESDKDRPLTKQSNKSSTTTSNKAVKDIQILDLNTDSDDVTSVLRTTDGKSDVFPEPWTADMYAGTSKCDNDRSTLNDDLSELDDKVGFRARGPGSWLSSNGSCSNLMIQRGNHDGTNDCFEIPRGVNGTPEYFTRTPDVIVENPNVIQGGGKSHQILRQAPKVHTPFVGVDKFTVPVPTAPAIPSRPITKNTQLKPISSLRTTPREAEIKTFPSLPGMRGTSHSFMTSRNMNEFENSQGGQAMRPFSEIPLTTTDTGQRNDNLLMNNAGGPQGPDSSHPYIQAMMRPVSETITTKRGGKIGMGPIMATKDKQLYARDIINAIEKQRLQPQQDAFHVNIPTPVPEAFENGNSDSEQNQEQTKKRHKVFTNSLIRGGYSYDKHSRRHTQDPRGSQSFSELHNSGEPPQINHSMSFQGGPNPATTSVSELTLSIRESSTGSGHGPAGPGFRHDPTPKQVQDMRHLNGNVNNYDQQIQHMTSRSYDGTNASRNNSLQTHTLGAQMTNYGHNNNQASAANHQTAAKFRKMRSRRDQEMDWLMKDAAETEV